MKLLFIQGGSKWKIDTENNLYTDSNYNEDIWNRYLSYCEDLTVVLRKESKVYSPEVAKKSFNFFNKKNKKFVLLDDLYNPKKNYINLKIRGRIKKEIKNLIRNSDRIIIRSLGNYYTNYAIKVAKKFNKIFLVEVTGCIFDGYWNHGIFGKLIAFPQECNYKRLIKNSPYTLYVTESFLQKKYPVLNKKISCSDVYVEIDENALSNRVNKIENKPKKIVIGTIGQVDSKLKGQQNIIKIIKNIEEKLDVKIEYQLIGKGNNNRLLNLAKKYRVENRVKFLGQVPHKEVLKWLDNIDIYIHPSYTEGLCRSIIEAMSRACPIICSDVGGNYELVDKEYLYKKNNLSQLIDKIEKILKPENMRSQAISNFESSKKFSNESLSMRRDVFYKEFINNN